MLINTKSYLGFIIFAIPLIKVIVKLNLLILVMYIKYKFAFLLIYIFFIFFIKKLIVFINNYNLNIYFFAIMYKKV